MGSFPDLQHAVVIGCGTLKDTYHMYYRKSKGDIQMILLG